MSYENYNRHRLIRLLKEKEVVIKLLKRDINFKTFLKLSKELAEERALRESYQNSTFLLQQEVRRYRILVGDEISTDD